MLTNRIEVAKALITLGADVNVTDELSLTPLMHAALVDYGDTEMVQLLLASGAATNPTSKDHHTALDLARQHRHDAIVRLLEQPARGQLAITLRRVAAAVILLIVATGLSPDAADDSPPSRARQFERAVAASNRLLQAWLAHADPRTLLLPDRPTLPPPERTYTPHNSGADLYPYLILTAELTDPDCTEAGSSRC